MTNVGRDHKRQDEICDFFVGDVTFLWDRGLINHHAAVSIIHILKFFKLTRLFPTYMRGLHFLTDLSLDVFFQPICVVSIS